MPEQSEEYLGRFIENEDANAYIVRDTGEFFVRGHLVWGFPYSIDPIYEGDPDAWVPDDNLVAALDSASELEVKAVIKKIRDDWLHDEDLLDARWGEDE